MHNENNFNEKTNGLYSIFAFLSLLLFSCEEKLPKPTQDGKNTFGCKIDGKTWIPNGGTGFMPAKPINGGFWNGLSSNLPYYIYIETYNKSNKRIYLYIIGNTIKCYIKTDDSASWAEVVGFDDHNDNNLGSSFEIGFVAYAGASATFSNITINGNPIN